LVERNRKMAAAMHRTSLKERFRRAVLTDLARVPISTQKHPPNRILLIRPDHLGDVLLTTPAIRALRRALPNVELHALVGPWSAGVLSAYDEIDVALTLPFPGFNRGPRSSFASPYQLLFRSARQLRKIGYQSAIVFRPDHWWGAMLAKYAGIPERIGYKLDDVKRFLTHAVEHEGGHAVLQSARLVERWTGPLDNAQLTYRFPVHEDDRLYVAGYLEEWGIERDQRIIVIHAGAGTWVKRWDNTRWPVVADTLAEQLDARVVLTGSDQEMPFILEIAQQLKTPSCLLVGDTTIGQLAALCERAQVVLGPDSGPLHLAAAVDTPTVSLFGPADPVEFGPWGPPDQHRILASPIGCRPCRVLDWNGDDPANHPCLGDISIGQVLDAARRAVQSRTFH
jgi:heptosyltransferase-2/heptosyltransferase-3